MRTRQSTCVCTTDIYYVLVNRCTGLREGRPECLGTSSCLVWQLIYFLSVFSFKLQQQSEISQSVSQRPHSLFAVGKENALAGETDCLVWTKKCYVILRWEGNFISEGSKERPGTYEYLIARCMKHWCFSAWFDWKLCPRGKLTQITKQEKTKKAKPSQARLIYLLSSKMGFNSLFLFVIFPTVQPLIASRNREWVRRSVPETCSRPKSLSYEEVIFTCGWKPRSINALFVQLFKFIDVEILFHSSMKYIKNRKFT
jgi:hypothetical protein